MNHSLFHSFPRPANSNADLHCALKTLRSVCDVGFVLAPEIIQLTEQLQNGRPGRIMTIGQKRMCFTAIEAHFIKEHAKTFGPFSIEFDRRRLSAAGATPVFYFPPTDIQHGVAGIAGSLILTLGDIANLLRELADIRDDIAARPASDTCTLTWGEAPNQRSAQLSVNNLSAVIAYLEHKHGAARTLQNNVRGLGQLFYPTHDSRRGTMEYYQQRAWRIISDITYYGRALSRALTDKEKQSLLACNERFFSKKITLLSGECVRVDECRVYTPPDTARAMELARRIICPRECIPQVQAATHEFNFALPVVALEDFPNTPVPNV